MTMENEIWKEDYNRTFLSTGKDCLKSVNHLRRAIFFPYLVQFHQESAKLKHTHNSGEKSSVKKMHELSAYLVTIHCLFKRAIF